MTAFSQMQRRLFSSLVPVAVNVCVCIWQPLEPQRANWFLFVKTSFTDLHSLRTLNGAQQSNESRRCVTLETSLSMWLSWQFGFALLLPRRNVLAALSIHPNSSSTSSQSLWAAPVANLASSTKPKTLRYPIVTLSKFMGITYVVSRLWTVRILYIML